MSTLVLELKPGESMILNGATIRFKTRARIELTSHARFLFGKQIMAEAEAATPAQQLYYQIQTAYVGGTANRETALTQARGLIAALTPAAPPMAREVLSRILALIETDSGFDALKLARQMVRYEAASGAADQEAAAFRKQKAAKKLL